MTINDLMAVLVNELAEGEVSHPLAQRFTLAHVWADLARLAGEPPLPVAVAAAVDAALNATCEPIPPANLPGLLAPTVAQWLRLD